MPPVAMPPAPIALRDAPAPRLAVTRLTLTQFRCYDGARLDADARPVVLTGPNGAGKTNLLEAVSFLSPGRGLRRARLADVERIGAPEGSGWAVAARVATPFGPVDIGTGRDGTADGQPERRLVRIDGHPVRGQVALAEHVALTWLTPQMDRLFVEGSSGRRRFLDRLVFGFDPAHAGRLSRYEHALRERGRLLRDGRGDESWLSALEDEMATSGVAVAAARRDMVARLQQACEQATGPFPRADLAVSGTVEDWLADQPALAAEDALRRRLSESRRHDGSGEGTAGPHRSDLAVRHRGKDMPAEFCSTGEQKALLIAIVLANARLMAAERGQPPLMLLDEVAAHLDADRRSALFGEILDLGAQAWLTGTDAGIFAELGDRASFFRVEDAHVHPA
ncbi:DNA replication/repair protein RecF [Skermanella rosea]|uniref:DNA replication/repair protein RecF n=1 Tax=Skermanella rosea TaxID=1817965 RepID=UPI001E63E30A|nr:DNA replication/repair protein RecF [Skermanella rosea]UEM03870.1 DNA replication/repair protein RecF [Skermanella rosea]